jgi:crossover junction endodeoxyribonuclease RuvC
MIVIWIDPWTTTVWYAIVEKNWNTKNLLDFWVISTTPKIPFEDKILEIINDLEDLIKKYSPEKAVIEKLYFATNTKTAIDVAQARWAIVYKLKSSWIKLEHYTPLELKSAICWNWKANKLQLQKAIQIFFQLETLPKPDDAADAIWLAYMGILKNN